MKDARFYVDRSGLRFRITVDPSECIREEDGTYTLDVHINELLDHIITDDTPPFLQTVYRDYFRSVLYAPSREMLLAALGVGLHRFIRENGGILMELLRGKRK